MQEGTRHPRVTQKDLATALGMNQATVSRILAEAPRCTYPPETRQRVLETAIRMGYLHPATVKTERRASARHALDATARVRILLASGRLYANCTAPVLDVSKTGLLLGPFRGRRRALPAETFHLEIELTGVLAGVRGRARPVRIESNGAGFGLGVAFLDLAPAHRFRIQAVLAARRAEGEPVTP